MIGILWDKQRPREFLPLILPFAITWMDFEHITLSEISQTAKNKFCMISLTGGILKSQTHNKQSKVVVTRVWEVEG